MLARRPRVAEALAEAQALVKAGDNACPSDPPAGGEGGCQWSR